MQKRKLRKRETAMCLDVIRLITAAQIAGDIEEQESLHAELHSFVLHTQFASIRDLAAAVFRADLADMVSADD